MAKTISRQALLAYIEKVPTLSPERSEEHLAFHFARINLPTPSNRCRNHRLQQDYPTLFGLFLGSLPADIRRSKSDRSLRTSNLHSSVRSHARLIASFCHRADSRTCPTLYDTPKSNVRVRPQLHKALPQSLYWESA